MVITRRLDERPGQHPMEIEFKPVTLNTWRHHRRGCQSATKMANGFGVGAAPNRLRRRGLVQRDSIGEKTGGVGMAGRDLRLGDKPFGKVTSH